MFMLVYYNLPLRLPFLGCNSVLRMIGVQYSWMRTVSMPSELQVSRMEEGFRKRNNLKNRFIF